MNEIAPATIDWWSLFTDPDFLRDPFAELARIREMAPVHHDARSDIYFVLGHEEFRSLTRAPEMGRDTRLWTNGWARPGNEEQDPLSYQLFSEFQRQMVNSNPPDHHRMRAVFEKPLRPSSMSQYQPMIEAEVRQLLQAIPADTPLDFMSTFANHLPLRVVRNLFEIPSSMDGQLAQWNTALLRIGDIMMTPEQKHEALAALRAYKAYLREHLSAHRTDSDGFIGLALTACADGSMDEEEALNNLLGLISGNETTATLLGNGMLSLLQHPEQLAKLRSNNDLMRPAIEEMLRYQPPINFILRVAISDFRCGEVDIPAGSLAIGLVAAINRDPASFEHPDVFDVGRRPNAHSVFGGGAHACIGKALARMQATAAFEGLLERFSRIELAGEPVWWADRTNQRGLQSLPVILGG